MIKEGENDKFKCFIIEGMRFSMYKPGVSLSLKQQNENQS